MPKDAEDIASGIVQNNQLRVLSLANNQLGSPGVQALFGALHERWKRHGAQPLELTICENGIEETGSLLDWLQVEKKSTAGVTNEAIWSDQHHSFIRPGTAEGSCIYGGRIDLGLDVKVLSLEANKGSMTPVQWPMCDDIYQMTNVTVWTD